MIGTPSSEGSSAAARDALIQSGRLDQKGKWVSAVGPDGKPLSREERSRMLKEQQNAASRPAEVAVKKEEKKLVSLDTIKAFTGAKEWLQMLKNYQRDLGDVIGGKPVKDWDQTGKGFYLVDAQIGAFLQEQAKQAPEKTMQEVARQIMDDWYKEANRLIQDVPANELSRQDRDTLDDVKYEIAEFNPALQMAAK